MTTTEVAVITFLLVGAAIVVLGIIYAAAKNNAETSPPRPRPRRDPSGRRPAPPWR